MPLDISSATPPTTGDVSAPASAAPMSSVAMLFGAVLDQTIGQTTQTEKPAGGKAATGLRQASAAASGNLKAAVSTTTGKVPAKYAAAAADTAAQVESTASAGTSSPAATQPPLVSALTAPAPASTNTKTEKQKDAMDHSGKGAAPASASSSSSSAAILSAIPLGIAPAPPLISHAPFPALGSKSQAMDTGSVSVSSGELLSPPVSPQTASVPSAISEPKAAAYASAAQFAAVQMAVSAPSSASSTPPADAAEPSTATVLPAVPVANALVAAQTNTVVAAATSLLPAEPQWAATVPPVALEPASGNKSASGYRAAPSMTVTAKASPAIARLDEKSAAPLLQNSPASADNDATAQPGNNAGITGQAAVGVKTHEASRDDYAAGDAISGKNVSHDAASSAGGAGTANAVPTMTVGSANTAAVPTQVSLTPADQAQAARQVQDGVQTWAAQAGVSGPTQVTVHLHPQEWGQVTVSVTMTPVTGLDGKTSTQIAAHVVADQSDVKTALETHQADLRQSLKDAGISLDRLTITVRPEAAAAQSGMNSNSFSDTRGGSGANASSSWLGESSAQSGAAGGGNSFSQSAAFSQGGQGSQGRHQAPTAYAFAGQPAEAEPSRILSSLRLSQSLLDTTA
jgi:flagellar hook-length control protein FliK